MQINELGRRLFDVMSSLRLAVTTMLVIGGTCAWATFYEAEHGTAAVQRDVYRTAWFAALLGLLATNIASVMASRWPWRSHHAGFLVAHAGILTILAGSLVSLHAGLDSNMALYEGETTDRVSLLDRALLTHVGSASGTFPVSFEHRPPGPGHEQRFPIRSSGVTLVADDYVSHAELSEQVVASDGGGPALHYVIEAPMGQDSGWLVASDPARRELSLGPIRLDIRETRDDAAWQDLLAAPRRAGQITLAVGPGAVLRALAGAATPPSAVALQQGKAVALAGVRLTVSEFLPHATVRRAVRRAEVLPPEDRRSPAVQVHLESAAGRSEPTWVVYGESQSLTFGGMDAGLAFGAPQAAVPFRVTLLRFNSEKYPGSRMPATYESWVRVDDPTLGTSEHHISMNHPLHYRGYIFFQSSFVEGSPMMSIFSVARAPGLPLVYLGTALIGIGTAWMFYVKPYLARRQAARALAAHQAKETAR